MNTVSTAVTATSTPGGWTVDTLREYMLAVINANEALAIQRFESSSVALQAALAAAKELVTEAQRASDRAVQKAEMASEKRFEGVNEFRGTLSDQQRTLMPRSEAEALNKALAERMDASLTAIGERVEINAKQLTELRGIKQGASEGWGWAVGVAGLVMMILGGVGATIALLVR